MDYQTRLSRLRQSMHDQAIDLLFLPISADLQYLTGIPRDMPNFGMTMYNGRWLEGALIRPTGTPLIVLPRMTAEFHLDGLVSGDVHVINDQENPVTVAQDLLQAFALGSAPRIAIGNTAYSETTVWFQSLIPGARFVHASELMRPLRRIKSPEEIQVMREAGAITEAAFTDVLAHLKHGMTEFEISAEVDLQLRRHGALGPSFVTSMYNSGPNHRLDLGLANTLRGAPLVPPIALLFDFGGVHNGYCYDFGRTVFFGEPDAEMLKIFNTIMAAQTAGIEAMRAGEVSCEAVDRAARTVVKDAGYGPYFRHRLGHSIGLDVHEPPFLIASDTTLIEEGMAFTIEPSILVPGGYAARIEDIVIARPGGGEPLTRGFLTLAVIS